MSEFTKKKGKSVSCLHVKLGSFTSYSCNDGKEMYKKKKKRDAHAMLLFCQSKPYCFLPFSLTSPLSLLKLPNELATSTGPEIAAEIQPMESPSFDGKTGNPFACLGYTCLRNSPTRLLSI